MKRFKLFTVLTVFLFFVISTGSYGYSVSIGSMYNVEYRTSFYDVNGNEIPRPQSDYPDMEGDWNTRGNGLQSFNVTLEQLASYSITPSCSDKTIACAEEIIDQFNHDRSGFLHEGSIYINHFKGVAQQNMFVEHETITSGYAFIESDNIEWFDVSVSNPLMGASDGTFNFVWDPVTDIERSYVAAGQPWHSSSGSSYRHDWNNDGLSEIARNDFIQFYLEDDNPSQVSNVPLPASVWLFGPVVILLLGFFQQKNQQLDSVK